MAFESILDILRKAQLKHLQFGKRMKEAEAVGRWEIAVGPQIAKHTRALRVEDGVLWVEVDHPIWKSELHHRKRQVLDLLNQGRPSIPGAPDPVLAPAKEMIRDLFLVEPRRPQSNRSTYSKSAATTANESNESKTPPVKPRSGR